MAGLQCWDQNGRLVVDLGDYMLKQSASLIVESRTGYFPQVDIPIAGVTESCFAVLNTDIIQGNIWVTSCYNGGVTIYFLQRRYFTGNATLEVFAYI